MFRMKDRGCGPCFQMFISIYIIYHHISKLPGRGVKLECSVPGSLLDRTGLLLASEILAGRCQAGGFDMRGLSLQVAPFS